MSRSRGTRWLVRVIVVVAILFLIAVLAFDVVGLGGIAPPLAPQVHEILTLDQNWSEADARWFYHTSQGTRIMRYDWFMALEQPEILMLRTPPLLHEPEYLQRFGFVYEGDSDQCAEALPIGLATEDGFRDPTIRQAKEQEAYSPASPHGGSGYKVIGLTCAACHTGQINYRGQGIRIDGGPALADLGTFQAAVRRALAYTRFVPFRFDRFARRVLEQNYNSETRNELWDELNQLIEAGLEEKLYADSKHLYDLKGGYGRTDALGLIGNRAFKDLNREDNLAMADAPVNFPPLWDAPWFEWVQYNASIRPPMVRNIGEALGVGALVVTNDLTGDLYDSTVNVENLSRIEQLLAGSQPFAGLRSPPWPSAVLGELDSFKVANGRTLFATHCKHCHPLIHELKQSLSGTATDPNPWVPADGIAKDSQNAVKVLQLPLCDLYKIGTDPAQALNLHKRVVFSPDGVVAEGVALLKVTAGIRERKYKELNLTPEQERVHDGHRYMPELKRVTDPKEATWAVAANLGYRARPLDGVWSTGPYLHNGSVPNLYELLLPVARRSKTFQTGGREFDPERVGFRSGEGFGSFKFDASMPGNRNQGHEFRNPTLEEFEKLAPDSKLGATEVQRWAAVIDISVEDFQKLSDQDRQRRVRRRAEESLGRLRLKGVLGPEFTEEERWSLVEYLKSL